MYELQPIKKKNNTREIAHMVISLKIVDDQKEDHFDLLLISNHDDDDHKHFAYIKNFPAFVHNQQSILQRFKKQKH